MIDFTSTAEFIAASVAQARSLQSEQKHEAARRTVCGLRRLANTIRSAAYDHGYAVELVLAGELASIEQLAAEIL